MSYSSIQWHGCQPWSKVIPKYFAVVTNGMLVCVCFGPAPRGTAKGNETIHAPPYGGGWRVCLLGRVLNR